MRILLVDDDESLSDLFCLFFKSKGHECVSFFSGPTLYAYLSNHSDFPISSLADLVLLDLGLPDGGGFVVLNHLRNTYPSLPVIIFSGDADDPPTSHKCMDAGAVGCISKGRSPSEVYSTLLSLLCKA